MTNQNSNSTITVVDAAKKLNIDIDVLRFALKEQYPSNFDSVKSINLQEFEILSQSLKVAATSGIKFLAGEAPEIAEIVPTADSEIKQNIVIGTMNALTDFMGCYHLNLSEITNAIAYVSAQKVVNDFVTIHSETIRDGLENYLDDFANQAEQAAKSIVEVDANDFLATRGIMPKGTEQSKTRIRSKEAVNSIFALLK